jgi:hypothetical protein
LFHRCYAPIASRGIYGVCRRVPATFAVAMFIETGSRSMLSYVTKPLMDQFSRAVLD